MKIELRHWDALTAQIAHFRSALEPHDIMNITANKYGIGVTCGGEYIGSVSFPSIPRPIDNKDVFIDMREAEYEAEKSREHSQVPDPQQ